MIPDDVRAALPERFETEQQFQNALRLALPRMLPVMLFRQVPGKHKQAEGAWMQGAPVGAADLTGWARGGLRVEIECKLAGRLTSRQARWRDACAEWGVAHLVAVASPLCDATTSVNVTAANLRDLLRRKGVPVA